MKGLGSILAYNLYFSNNHNHHKLEKFRNQIKNELFKYQKIRWVVALGMLAYFGYKNEFFTKNKIITFGFSVAMLSSLFDIFSEKTPGILYDNTHYIHIFTNIYKTCRPCNLISHKLRNCV